MVNCLCLLHWDITSFHVPFPVPEGSHSHRKSFCVGKLKCGKSSITSWNNNKITRIRKMNLTVNFLLFKYSFKIRLWEMGESQWRLLLRCYCFCCCCCCVVCILASDGTTTISNRANWGWKIMQSNLYKYLI